VWSWSLTSWPPKLIASCPCGTVDHVCQLASSVHSFPKYHVHECINTCLVMVTDGQKNGQVENIVTPSVRLVSLRHKLNKHTDSACLCSDLYGFLFLLFQFLPGTCQICWSLCTKTQEFAFPHKIKSRYLCVAIHYNCRSVQSQCTKAQLMLKRTAVVK